MKFKEVISVISELVSNKYMVENIPEEAATYLELAPEELVEKNLIRIKRKENSTGKTLLLTSLKSETDLKLSLRWAASVKDKLLNPETADLYLFIVWDDKINFSIDDCLRIEASEDFCRKYVVYPNESKEDFIARTFLKKIEQEEQNELGKDPLIEAFSKVAEKNDWFNDQTQEKWRLAFKSGVSGAELVDKLFKIKS